MILGFILMLAAGEAPPARCTEAPPSSYESTDYRILHFYSAPSIEAFARIQRGMQCAAARWESRQGATDVLAAVFLARVHEKHGYPLLDIGPLDDRAMDLTRPGGSAISRYVDDDGQVDEEKLDIWWVSYFATGDSAYLDRIVRWVGDPGTQAGAALASLVGMANRSVAANCRQHVAVLQYVESLLKRDPPVPNAGSLRRLVSGGPCLRVVAPFPPDSPPGHPDDLAGTWFPSRQSQGRDGALQRFSPMRDPVRGVCIVRQGMLRIMQYFEYDPARRRWGLRRLGQVFNVDGMDFAVPRELGSSLGCGGLVSLEPAAEGLLLKWRFPPEILMSPEVEGFVRPATLVERLRGSVPDEFTREIYVREPGKNLPRVPCADEK